LLFNGFKTYSLATELLGLAGGRSLAPLLYPDLNSDSIWVRTSAIRSLGNMKDTTSEKLLVEQINNSDYRVRWQIASSLGKIGTA